jgi:protein-L-isoaspartate(D-aspartate) O-methyltransferase
MPRGTMSGPQELVRELRGAIADERVLRVMASVPRPLFVPPELRDQAWDNVALGIGHGQTISQPLVVARMAELLDVHPGHRILDVGTGSGYHAAVLAALGGEVVSIERDPRLSAAAGRALAEAGVQGVTLVVGDGAEGAPGYGPFDAINVAAASRERDLLALEAHLAPGGRLVGPLEGRRQRLALAERRPEGVARRLLEEVRFVPLVRGVEPGET